MKKKKKKIKHVLIYRSYFNLEVAGSIPKTGKNKKDYLL